MKLTDSALSFLTDSGPASDAHTGFRLLDGFVSSYLADLLGLDTTVLAVAKISSYAAHC